MSPSPASWQPRATIFANLLQTLILLQSLLAKVVEGQAVRNLVALPEPTLTAMSGMLNTLLDINEIDAGTVHDAVVRSHVNNLPGRRGQEFNDLADASGITLRKVPWSRSIQSDPRLLEQMIRTLLTNAIKYTRYGPLLLGCRRHADVLRIEVWDTGIGIPEAGLQAVFEEYHQLDNPARERSRGLGLAFRSFDGSLASWVIASPFGPAWARVPSSPSRCRCFPLLQRWRRGAWHMTPPPIPRHWPTASAIS